MKLGDSAEELRQESEAKLRAPQMQENVANCFESLRQEVEDRRANLALGPYRACRRKRRVHAKTAVAFAVYALREAEYYQGRCRCRPDADTAKTAAGQ